MVEVGVGERGQGVRAGDRGGRREGLGLGWESDAIEDFGCRFCAGTALYVSLRWEMYGVNYFKIAFELQDIYPFALTRRFFIEIGYCKGK